MTNPKAARNLEEALGGITETAQKTKNIPLSDGVGWLRERLCSGDLDACMLHLEAPLSEGLIDASSDLDILIYGTNSLPFQAIPASVKIKYGPSDLLQSDNISLLNCRDIAKLYHGALFSCRTGEPLSVSHHFPRLDLPLDTECKTIVNAAGKIFSSKTAPECASELIDAVSDATMALGLAYRWGIQKPKWRIEVIELVDRDIGISLRNLLSCHDANNSEMEYFSRSLIEFITPFHSENRSRRKNKWYAKDCLCDAVLALGRGINSKYYLCLSDAIRSIASMLSANEQYISFSAALTIIHQAGFDDIPISLFQDKFLIAYNVMDWQSVRAAIRSVRQN